MWLCGGIQSSRLKIPFLGRLIPENLSNRGEEDFSVVTVKIS